MSKFEALIKLARLKGGQKNAKSNLLIGFSRKGLTSFLSFIMLPLYLPLLGKEAYGLIALGVSTLAIVSFLIRNLFPIWIREITKRVKREERISEIIRLQEYLFIPLITVILLFFPLYIHHIVGELTLKELGAETVTNCLFWIFIAACFDLIRGVYVGAYIGYKNFSFGAVLFLIKSIIDHVGGYIVLRVTNGNIECFFLCMATSSVITALTPMVTFWWQNRREFFYWRIKYTAIKPIFGLAGASLTVGGLMAFTTFYERFVIGKVLSLETLGVYALTIVPLVIITNFGAIIRHQCLPYLTDSIEASRKEHSLYLIRTYTNITQLLFYPVILALWICPASLLFIWLRDIELATEISEYIRWAIIMFFIHAMYDLWITHELASGRAKLRFTSAIIVSASIVFGIGMVIVKNGIVGFFQYKSLCYAVPLIISFCYLTKVFTFKKTKHLFLNGILYAGLASTLLIWLSTPFLRDPNNHVLNISIAIIAELSLLGIFFLNPSSKQLLVKGLHVFSSFKKKKANREFS